MKSLNKNNKGISLIEIVVTVAVISIVIIPLISSFFTAMEINSDSRRIQNATYVAQDIMEVINNKDIAALNEFSLDTFDVTVEKSNKTDNNNKEFPIYIYNGWAIQGADEELYLVDVILDSSVYATLDGSTSVKNPVNSLTQPEFSSLFGSDVIMLFRQYTSADNQLESYFRSKGCVTEAEIQDMKDNPSKVKKHTTMSIECKYTGSLYNYIITLDMYYTYNNNTSKQVSVTRTVNKTYDTAEGHAIYFMMSPFDVYSTSLGSTSKGYYSSDALDITYKYTSTGGSSSKPAPEIGLFLTAQEVPHKQNASMVSLIDSSKIKYKTSMTSSGTSLYKYNNTGKKLQIYTNIAKSPSDFGSADNIFGITESEELVSSLMYDVTINVYEAVETGEVTETGAIVVTKGTKYVTFSGSKED